MFDPFDLHFFGAPLEMSRQAIYTMGFFGFWALGIASSALTIFLESGPRPRDGGDGRIRRRLAPSYLARPAASASACR